MTKTKVTKKKTVISVASLAKLHPCSERFDNFKNHYSKRNLSISAFLGLKNITHRDKLWVAFRKMPKKSISKAAGEIALSVVHIFENRYPGDVRPRLAAEAAIRGYKNAAYAANAAADAAAYAAADAAANAAAYAAANAANAAYAAADAAANAAAYAANAAADSRAKQEALQLKIIKKYWK